MLNNRTNPREDARVCGSKLTSSPVRHYSMMMTMGAVAQAPARRTTRLLLSREEVRALSRHVAEVPETIISLGAASRRFPENRRDGLSHRRL
jgi:hypothetical protein